MLKRLVYICENFLLRFDFYKNNLIMKSWYYEALPGVREDNPNRDINLDRLIDYINQIYEKHFDSLDANEREKLKNVKKVHEYPEYENMAIECAQNLKEELSKFDYISDVTPGAYHFGIYILTVYLSYDPGFKSILKNVPYLYHGFRVKIFREFKNLNNNSDFKKNDMKQIGIKTEFIHGNIIDIEADGLVCSGNVYLNMSGGVNGELLSRGGSELQIQLHQYLKMNNIKFVKPGFVIDIGPGNFHFKCIVYSVAINAWYDSDIELVKNTLIKAFSILEKKKCKIINVPALATGYGRLEKVDFATALKEALLSGKWNFKKIQIIDQKKDNLKILEKAFYQKQKSANNNEKLKK